MKGGKHHSHNYEDLNQAFEKYKGEMTSLLEPMEKQVTVITKELAQLNKHRDDISSQQATIKDNIQVTFKRLREVLSARETELIGQLHQTTQDKLKGLGMQVDQIETKLAQLTSCLSFIRESLKTGNEKDVLMMKMNTARQAKELTIPLHPDIMNSDIKANMAFEVSADSIEVCRNYGKMISSGVEDAPGLPTGKSAPAMGEASERVLAPQITGARASRNVDKNEISVQPGRYENVSMARGKRYALQPVKSSLKYVLVPQTIGTRASDERGENEEIGIQPDTKGKYHVYMNIEDTTGTTPSSAPAARPMVKKLRMPMLAIRGMGGPQGVAVNHKGEVVVTDRNGHSVSAFTPSGAEIRSFGTHGSSKGQLRHPRGIVIDCEGNILVADSSNHRIQKFTSEGRFLMSVGTKGKEPLQFSSPSDLVFNNNVYVVDCGNHRIQILKSDLTFSGSFGKEGRGKGQFSHPRGIACDSTGKVYVADRDNHRIQVFTAEGKFLRMFGKRGQGRGELDMPICVAVNLSHFVIISEGGNHRISVFTSEGQFVKLFGRQGETLGEFNFPCGLAVDTSGVVYVCDYRNSHVQILKEQLFC